MKRARTMTAVLFLLGSARAAEPRYALASGDNNVASADAAWKADLLTWRDARAKRLSAPDGWLTLVGLDWLAPGENSVGTAAGTRVHLGSNAGPAAANLGTLVLENDKVTLHAPQGGFPAGLQEDGATPHEGPVSFDEEHPTKLTTGTLLMTIIKRGERYAVRTKDSQAPTRVGFHGLHWYAPDAHYRVVATWTPYVPVHTLKIPTVLGTTDEMPSPGAAEFTIGGKVVRLEPVLEDPDATQLFFILRDRTGRTTTDGAARFLYAAFPDNGLTKPGKIVLDFNRLYNPPCAFTSYATCPLPPPQNRLSVALPVGELRYTP